MEFPANKKRLTAPERFRESGKQRCQRLIEANKHKQGPWALTRQQCPDSNRCGRSNNRVLFGMLWQWLSQGLGARNWGWEVPSLIPGRNSPFLTLSATYFFHLRTMTEKTLRFMSQWDVIL